MFCNGKTYRRTRVEINMKKNAGFSLFELMITAIIIGILCALSWPIYSEHVVHSKRLEAEVNLVKLAESMEQYYLSNNTYENATLEKLGVDDKVADDQYQLQIINATASDFLIEAIPINHQSNSDSYCGTLTLDAKSKRGISGPGNARDCWH